MLFRCQENTENRRDLHLFSQAYKIPQTHFSSIPRNQIPVASKKNSSDSSTLILSAVSHQAPTGKINKNAWTDLPQPHQQRRYNSRSKPFLFFPVEFARFENLELLRASRGDDVKLYFRAVNPKETKKQIPPSTPSLRNPKLRQKSRILPSDGSTFNLFVSYNLGTVITYVHHPIQTLITKFRHMFLKYVSILCTFLWGAKFGLTASFTNKWQAVLSRGKKTMFQAKHAS